MEQSKNTDYKGIITRIFVKELMDEDALETIDEEFAKIGYERDSYEEIREVSSESAESVLDYGTIVKVCYKRRNEDTSN